MTLSYTRHEFPKPVKREALLRSGGLCEGEGHLYGSSVFDVIKHYTLALATTPPGMVCVPVEPTKEMCEAAEALPAIDGVNDLPLAKAGWSPRAIQNLKRYRAMLAAHGGKE